MLQENIPASTAQDLSQVLAQRLGLRNVQYLKGGGMGKAFVIDQNRILKITSDVAEFNNSMRLLGKTPKYLPNIYLCKNIKYNDEIYYVIVQEKIDTSKSKEYFQLFYELEMFLSSNYKIYNDDLFDDFTYNDNANKEILSALNKYNRNLFQFVIQIFYCLKEAKNFNIQTNDIHSDNLGLKDGHLCIFDLTGDNNFTHNHNEPENLD